MKEGKATPPKKPRRARWSRDESREGRERRPTVRARIANGREAGRAAIARARARARSAIGNDAAAQAPVPHLALLRAPAVPMATSAMHREIRAATYNVHRWSGLNGSRGPDAARAALVISENAADVKALKEMIN